MAVVGSVGQDPVIVRGEPAGQARVGGKDGRGGGAVGAAAGGQELIGGRQRRPGTVAREQVRDLVLPDAADHGHTEAVRLILDLGFPPGARSEQDNGATALHLSAAAGSIGTVRLLLERGADIEARDTAWNSTPLEWAIVGSGMRLGHDPDPDWPATVSALLDAGASTDGIALSPDDPKPPSPEVAALLRARGIPDEEASTAGG